MTIASIQSHISRCIEIQKSIATLEAEEKAIKAKLAKEAVEHPKDHIGTEGGGWSWTFADADGNIARVTQPALKLKSKIDPDSKTCLKAHEIAGRRFMELFVQVPSYRPVEDFREKAEKYLGKSEGNKLIKLVTTESAISVSFEVAQKEAA